MFVLWQEWLWPMWTPACLVTRPLRLLSVSENICWTWFPPVLFPKLQTHGNNAISLPLDVTTLSFLNINNNHSHYHSDLFYELCLSQQWSLGRIRFVFFLHLRMIFSPHNFLIWIFSKLKLYYSSRDTMLNKLWLPFLKVGIGVCLFHTSAAMLPLPFCLLLEPFNCT